MTAKLNFIFQHSSDIIRTACSNFWGRSREVILVNWHLGLTAFGGPPVHYHIFHDIFVLKHKWITEQFYQEIFAISQALPGPGSTKMLFCINYSRGGFMAALCAFLLWSLPGAIGMYALSVGVARVGDTLPAPVFALISGLNAATVGIIIFAAVQLAKKAITDKLTRVLVFFGAASGMLYTALWFFPIILLAAGFVTVVWDFGWLHKMIRSLKRERLTDPESMGRNNNTNEMELQSNAAVAPRQNSTGDEISLPLQQVTTTRNESASESESSEPLKMLSMKKGVVVIIGFMISFVAIMILRGLLTHPPRGYSLFANLYLAGTIIFGGGPVVIPLLREYIVAEGWVSARNFLLGLALIQAFPGPNFNFAVYLGALATVGSSLTSFEGALIAFVAIFVPGIMIQTGIMGLWKGLRERRWFLCLLRGVNATAVGFIYTAVYKLWRIGFVDAESQMGSSLGRDPWFVIITGISFVGVAWFGLSAALAILLGAVMGLIWYAIVKP